MTACEDEELRGARQGDGSAAHQRDGRTVDDPDSKTDYRRGLATAAR